MDVSECLVPGSCGVQNWLLCPAGTRRWDRSLVNTASVSRVGADDGESRVRRDAMTGRRVRCGY
jgi:hypothetical protein